MCVALIAINQNSRHKAQAVYHTFNSNCQVTLANPEWASSVLPTVLDAVARDFGCVPGKSEMTANLYKV